MTMVDLSRFPWGEVRQVHSIGDIEVVEFYGRQYEDGQTSPDVDRSVSLFHPYLNGEDLNQSYDTLDGAVVGAIAFKYEGSDSRAAYYFWRMVNRERGV